MNVSLIDPSYLSASVPYEKAKAVILGCPYDGSASFRPGARFGPSAIRKASWGIETYSPYLGKDLGQHLIHDLGDLELPLGEKRIALDWIRKALKTILEARKFPILLGGDHLITLPIVEEIQKVYPDLHLLHLDAHADLRDHYLGEALSHSTVMRRVIERIGEGRLFQVGIRSGTEEEFALSRKMKSLVKIDEPSIQSLVKRLGKKPVYISLDLDILDPGVCPGVGTPEPGGLTFRELLSLLKILCPLRVIGFDLVELTPDYDPAQISSVTASVLLREMILAFCP
ncbi:MAG: agmatinase [Desulfobacterota bacterium]|nr:agmatinase [Thermodesulfobacteriota bacterium]